MRSMTLALAAAMALSSMPEPVGRLTNVVHKKTKPENRKITQADRDALDRAKAKRERKARKCQNSNL